MVRLSWFLVPIAILSGATVRAQTTARMSVDSVGTQGNGASFSAAISADSRYVAFASSASNLVPGDSNGWTDVFLRDRIFGTIERVSVDSSGLQANGDSTLPAISADGRYVAFTSRASNLVPADTNGKSDIFVRDRVGGTTTRVSVSSSGAEGNGESGNASISSDGRYVAFDSFAATLVLGDTNGKQDVFVRDLVLGTTLRVSVSSAGVQGNGFSGAPSISGDGSRVAFSSDAGNLVVGGFFVFHIYLRDLAGSVTTQVDVTPNGSASNGGSFWPSISSDGRFIAYGSSSSDLVRADANGAVDIFVRDLAVGETSVVSVTSSGAQASGTSARASISFEGRYVTFMSDAPDLVTGDTNASADIFVHDRLVGETQRVSVSSSASEGDRASEVPRISADGRWVAFESFADNLVTGDTNAVEDVFLRDRGADASFVGFCFGDGSSGPCPCGNPGLAERGCANSRGSGGAILMANGTASLSDDQLFLISGGELNTALSVLLQGSQAIAPTSFGGGLRCAGGVLKRLDTRNASGGTIVVPQSGDPTISQRSAALGDPIPLGASRIYQVYYRDPNLGFCPAGFNVTMAVAVAWGL